MSEYNEEKVIKEILKDVNGDIEKLNGEDLGFQSVPNLVDQT
jgi:hypothetical protein